MLNRPIFRLQLGQIQVTQVHELHQGRQRFMGFFILLFNTEFTMIKVLELADVGVIRNWKIMHNGKFKESSR